jgi:integrase
MTPGQGDAVSWVIEHYTPRSVSAEAARFSREVVSAAIPASPTRAKAFLFAASRLGAFAERVGLELVPDVVLVPSVIERCCHPAVSSLSAPTRRTLRANLRSLARAVHPGTAPVHLSRERAKAPYTEAQIAAYLALCDAQPTDARRWRASALVCVSAGAGLVGADLKALCGSDVVRRDGGLVVRVRGGRRPRAVPVLWRYHDRLLGAAAWAGSGPLIGGTSPGRRNVTTPLTASLAGGADLPRLDISRLRATWLCAVARQIGLKAFMDAAGITCSQRLGDLVAHLPCVSEPEALAVLGGMR